MEKNELLLMSIKTKYASRIFAGTKEYEFRRKSIGEKNCYKKIYIYSSEEEKAIVGYIIVDKILNGNLKKIQALTNSFNNKGMDNYFNGCEECYALHISEYYKFIKPIKLADIKSKYEKFVVPQFYRYIKEEEPIYDLLESTLVEWKHIKNNVITNNIIHILK